MPHTTVVTFTSRTLDDILQEGGSRDWRLDPQRAAKAEFLVCTQNRHKAGFGAPAAPHGAAFLIGRISAVVPSPDDPSRWLIKFSEYTIPPEPIPNIWGKFGHQRYPIAYTTLEELGIDLAALPPFQPAGTPAIPRGLADVSGALLMPAPAFTSRPHRPARQTSASDPGIDPADRLDAILAQLDRIPDLATPADPLAWDEYGLPQ